MSYREALDQYGLLVSMVSDVAFFKDVDWEQEKHIEALKMLSELVDNSEDGG